MLIKLEVPLLIVDALGGEWCHAAAGKDGTAKILSVVEHDSAYQFGDVVRYCEHEHDPQRFRALDIVKPGNHTLHRIYGREATPDQAMRLTDEMREQDLHIEVWSLTVHDKDKRPETKPLRAGLVLQPDMDPLEAMLRLRLGARFAGLSVLCPTLSKAAGDEVGWMRDRRGLRNMGLAA